MQRILLARLPWLALFSLLTSAQGGGAPTNVRVDPVQEAVLQERRLVQGDVKAARRARVASEEAGSVLARSVVEGDRVVDRWPVLRARG